LRALNFRESSKIAKLNTREFFIPTTLNYAHHQNLICIEYQNPHCKCKQSSLVEKKIKFWVCQALIMKKLLKSVQMLHLQTMRLGVLKPYRKSAESKKFSGELRSSKNAKLKCREFSKLQKSKIKMQ